MREDLLSPLAEAHAIDVVGEAVNLADRLQPDVVAKDVSMLLIDGDDATRQIRQRLPKTRVIALSMYEDSKTVEQMRRAGAERCVLKTAPSEEFLAAIRGQESDA